MSEYRELTIAARTHGQQAVPTTLGAKFAVYLAELTRQQVRLQRARTAVGVVSLFGAGGTSAAMGVQAPTVRAELALALGLRTTDIPWHVSRDGLLEFGAACASLSATCVRFAREIIDLSRTEINEVGEASTFQRGASSTMPQKANPVDSEAVIGLGISAEVVAGGLLRAMEAGHERAAGEWQIEWYAVPHLAFLASSCLRLTLQVAGALVVRPEAVAANLEADGGLLMSEALMMQLSPKLGHITAHDLVYRAARESRATQRPLTYVVRAFVRRDHPGIDWDGQAVQPSEYVGEAHLICDRAIEEWHRRSQVDMSDRPGYAGG